MSEFHKCIKCGYTKEVGKKCQCEVFDKMSETHDEAKSVLKELRGEK